MRSVRRKSSDPSAASYFKKAGREGVILSWNRYENMLPQDGFASLGLCCFDCLLGPCRINPFSQKEEKTICGFSRDELVYRNLMRMLGCESCSINCKNDNGFRETTVNIDKLTEFSIKEINKLYAESSHQENITERKVGLGVLNEDYINICIEGSSADTIGMFLKVSENLKETAVESGARGFNILVIGDIISQYPCNIVSDKGGAELAILTGLVDSYITDVRTVARVRNVIDNYHTYFAQIGDCPEESEITSIILSAANAYKKREKSKIEGSSQIETLIIESCKAERIKELIESGKYNGLCILGNSSNLKLTQDEILCETAKMLIDKRILTITYGNGAVTLAKHGLLKNNDNIIVIGGNSSISEIISILSLIPVDKTLAIFPEITDRKDLITVFAFAGSVKKVITCSRLPVEGSIMISKKIGELIEYVKPEDTVNRIASYLVGK
ncbi:MAG TPA: hypothetical protein GXX20_01685 [Clostridiaceae bacterium]|nr:hypothetical protein [Clostridiaceae bacterium]